MAAAREARWGSALGGSGSGAYWPLSSVLGDCPRMTPRHPPPPLYSHSGQPLALPTSYPHPSSTLLPLWRVRGPL